MQNLHERWGLSTSEIARALDIPQRVARLARDGSEPAEGADQLDRFLASLVELGIDEPASWMGETIVEGYRVTRWDLYINGRADLLGENAEGDFPDVEMLAAFDPDWRRNYWTSFTTFVAEDGNLSTRGKTYDEIRAQV